MNKRKIFYSGVVRTILCVAAVAAIFVFALLYRDIFGYPWFLSENQPDSENKTQIGGDNFDKLLENNFDGEETDNVGSETDENDDIEIIKVSEENFRTVIENILPLEAFAWEFEVTTSDGENSLTEHNILTFDGEKYEIDVTVDGVLQRSVADDGENVTVSEYVPHLTSNTYSSKITDVFSRCRLATPENFLTLPPETVDFECSLTKGVYGNIALLEFSYTTTTGIGAETDGNQAENAAPFVYREKYKISLDYGLVISAETYENEVLVYELETLLLKDSLDDEQAQAPTDADGENGEATQE